MVSSLLVERILEGVILLGGTVALQFLAQVVLKRRMRTWRSQRAARLSIRGFAVEGHPFVAVLVLLVAVLLQGLLWAVAYYHWGELGSFSNAFYFSIASFSTVGASDLTLSPGHRLVGALEAAMGMLMFGWSTALLVQVVQESRSAETSD
jgi:hypothetical protein